MEQEIINANQITSSEARTTFCRTGWGYFSAALLNTIPSAIIIGILYMIDPMLIESHTILLCISIATLYFLGLPVACIVMNRLPKCTIGNKKMHIGQIISSLLIGYTLVVISNAIGLAINAALGKLTGLGLQNPIANTLSDLNPIVNILIVSIMAPIMEEMVFRKVLVDRIYRYGEGLTVFVSGLMFGLFHGNLAQFAYAFILGMYLAFIYMRTGRIRYTIYIHMFINTIGTCGSLIIGDIDVVYIQDKLFSGDIAGYMEYVNKNLQSIALLGLYGMIVVAIIITGFILMIINQKRFRFNPIDGALPTGKSIAALFGNIGMIAFMLYFVIEIVCAQYATSLSTLITKLMGVK